MKILHINSVYGIRSTGRIVKELHNASLNHAWESHVIYGRIQQSVDPHIHYIGNRSQVIYEMAKTALFGHHAMGSFYWTKQMIQWMDDFKPDIIHLHNIHGYYLNVEMLFEYLKKTDVQLVWTLHDCWSYTGHCAYYSFLQCDKWKDECHHCPALRSYPYSIITDRSKLNYREKQSFFTGMKNCTLVTPSKWLKDEIGFSFLKDYPVEVIPNGIDLETFKPREVSKNLCYTILAVANIWEERKGLKYCLELAECLSEDEQLVIIGLNAIQLKGLPKNIIGIKRTESMNELVEWYNRADVFINPTLEDNFPTTKLEALACGTPIVTFATGGSVESINDQTGLVVETNTQALYKGIQGIKSKGKNAYREHCRQFAEQIYGSERMKQTYLDLYERIIKDA